MFTRYNSNAFVNLDWTTTFTPTLLRKDLDLGLEAGRQLGVPMPVTAATALQRTRRGMLRSGPYCKDSLRRLETWPGAASIEPGTCRCRPVRKRNEKAKIGDLSVLSTSRIPEVEPGLKAGETSGIGRSECVEQKSVRRAVTSG